MHFWKYYKKQGSAYSRKCLICGETQINVSNIVTLRGGLKFLDNWRIIKKSNKRKHMNNLLYIIAVILVIGWAVGFLVFQNTNGIIHILLVIAVIAVILRLIQGSGYEKE